jgi:hypothetical protein
MRNAVSVCLAGDLKHRNSRLLKVFHNMTGCTALRDGRRISTLAGYFARGWEKVDKQVAVLKEKYVRRGFPVETKVDKFPRIPAQPLNRL